MSLFYLLNLTDERPDKLSFPVGNETDPEIKVETLTGNDTQISICAGLVRNSFGFTPDQMFSWNDRGNNVNIVGHCELTSYGYKWKLKI